MSFDFVGVSSKLVDVNLFASLVLVSCWDNRDVILVHNTRILKVLCFYFLDVVERVQFTLLELANGLLGQKGYYFLM